MYNRNAETYLTPEVCESLRAVADEDKGTVLLRYYPSLEPLDACMILTWYDLWTGEDTAFLKAVDAAVGNQ